MPRWQIVSDGSGFIRKDQAERSCFCKEQYVIPVGPDVSYLIWRPGSEKPERGGRYLANDFVNGYYWGFFDGENWEPILPDEWAELPERTTKCTES